MGIKPWGAALAVTGLLLSSFNAAAQTQPAPALEPPASSQQLTDTLACTDHTGQTVIYMSDEAFKARGGEEGTVYAWARYLAAILFTRL